MNNDLISRSTLKEDIDFEHICNCCNNHCGNVCDDCSISEIEKKIDNAPTVELTESEVQEVLNKRCMTAVANEYLIALHGKTERPKGDLISRQDAIDALEEQLDYLQMLNKNENPTAEGKWYGVNWARNTIADLPYKQNERPKESKLVKAYLKGFNTGVEIVKNARLQGEWITNGEFDSKDVCSVCKKRFWYRCMTIDLNRIEDIWNFCPNCGAEMQKGGANNDT